MKNEKMKWSGMRNNTERRIQNLKPNSIFPLTAMWKMCESEVDQWDRVLQCLKRCLLRWTPCCWTGSEFLHVFSVGSVHKFQRQDRRDDGFINWWWGDIRKWSECVAHRIGIESTNRRGAFGEWRVKEDFKRERLTLSSDVLMWCRHLCWHRLTVI